MEQHSEEVRIEHMQPGQLDALIDAQNEIFEDYIIRIRSSKQFFLDFVSSVGGDLRNVLLALDGSRVVGYVNPVADGREGWIGGIGILREYRGQGIGTRLMNEAERELGAEGVREVSLEVIDGNTRAEKLYRHLGYQPTRKYLSAEGIPSKYQGFGTEPKPATLSEVLPIHSRCYADTCWQRRKTEAVVQSSKGSETFKVDGGFVMVRAIDTSGFIPFLGVEPEKRRRGIGTSLAKFALSRLHDMGAFKTALYNVNEDEATLRMLDMFDFKVTMKQTEMRKVL
jgi:ribosomal protein S18 acetylase RimI-like enzyme